MTHKSVNLGNSGDLKKISKVIGGKIHNNRLFITNNCIIAAINDTCKYELLMRK